MVEFSGDNTTCSCDFCRPDEYSTDILHLSSSSLSSTYTNDKNRRPPLHVLTELDIMITNEYFGSDFISWRVDTIYETDNNIMYYYINSILVVVVILTLLLVVSTCHRKSLYIEKYKHKILDDMYK